MSANLPKVSYDGVTPKGPSGPTLPSPGENLAFLEATPYWDQSNVPINVAKQKNPFIGKIVSAQRIVGPKAPGEICNIVIDHRGTMYMRRYRITKIEIQIISLATCKSTCTLQR